LLRRITPYCYPIKIVIGTLSNSLITALDSANFLSNNFCLDVSSRYALNLSINAFLSAVDDANKSAWLRVTSAPGIGTWVYLPLS
jgi:hypothetical protein